MKKIIPYTFLMVTPSYNQAKFLEETIKSVTSQKGDFRVELFVADGGSSDETAAIAKKHAEHVLIHKVNLGKGAALKTGCEYAFGALKAEAVIFMDSDAQHNPKELDLFFEKLLQGANVVLGVRAFDSSMPWIKITSNRVASVVVHWLYGAYIPDIPSGYKAFTEWAYQRVKWNSSDYRVELEIAVNLAKRHVAFATVPVQTIYLDFDRGFHLLDALQMGLDLLSWRFTK